MGHVSHHFCSKCLMSGEAVVCFAPAGCTGLSCFILALEKLNIYFRSLAMEPSCTMCCNNWFNEYICCSLFDSSCSVWATESYIKQAFFKVVGSGFFAVRIYCLCLIVAPCVCVCVRRSCCFSFTLLYLNPNDLCGVLCFGLTLKLLLPLNSRKKIATSVSWLIRRGEKKENTARLIFGSSWTNAYFQSDAGFY